MNGLSFRYYLITDRSQCRPRSLTDVVEKACRNGIKGVQLREKDLSGQQLYKLAKELRDITYRWNCRLFINDRADIALAIGADGVHVRESGMRASDIKKLDSMMLVGASVHSTESAKRAERENADFLLFGPVFYTPSKARYGSPKGIEQLKKVTASVALPVYAVGGVTPKNGQNCLSAGACGIAGISSIMATTDIESKISEWRHTTGTL